MAEISEDINFIKEVGLARDHFREVAVIRCFQDVRRGQSFHSGIYSMDFQHTAEHDAVQRHTLHGPDFH